MLVDSRLPESIEVEVIKTDNSCDSGSGANLPRPPFVAVDLGVRELHCDPAALAAPVPVSAFPLESEFGQADLILRENRRTEVEICFVVRRRRPILFRSSP